MVRSLEYHEYVQRSIPASLARFGVLLLPLLLVSASLSQNNTTSSSSVHSFNAAAPGVTSSAGHSSPVPTHSGVTSSATTQHSTWSNHRNNGNHRPRSTNGTAYYYPYFYAVPVPYAVDGDATNDENNNDDDANYQGGPTIFDRRGSGPDSYIPPVNDPPAQTQSPEREPAAYSEADPPQAPTLLVFKDGHELEIANYAIVSQTLYDLTHGHPRKIALADLDLPATEKQNDDRGVTFQLPPTAQAN